MMNLYFTQKCVSILFVIISFTLISPCKAQYIPSDPMRYTSWNPGVTYTVTGGIPNRTQIYTTIQASTFGNGTTDASDAINIAIQACPSGQVVKLSAGTFKVNNLLQISKSITLRGAGPGATLLQKTNGAVFNVEGPGADAQPIIIIGPSRWPGPDATTSQNLTTDAAKGNMSVTLTNSSGFSAGQFVLLDELSGAVWKTDKAGQGQIWASSDYRVVWKAHKPNILDVDDFNPDDNTTLDPLSWFCRTDRPTAEIKEISSVIGNVINFTTPMHINYRSSHTAQLTRYTDAWPGNVQVTNAGVENISVKGGSDGAIRFECAAYSWAKNIEISVWIGEGVSFDNSFRCEIRDSYIHDAAYSSPGGGAYAISLADGSSEILVENTISMLTNKVMVARCAGAGSVFGYNYVDDGFINYDENWIESGLNASHMVGPHHVLFEGNYGFNWDSDNTHGNAIYHTIFRNWLRGVRRPYKNPQTGHVIDDDMTTASGPKDCARACTYSYWMTFVGNVLGAEGKMSGWVYDASVTGGWDVSAIWELGWDHEFNDPDVAGTAIREGNWDWLQSKQSWQNSSAVTLQNSLYLKSKPSFFGSKTWPWVDPTTGTTYTLPAKVRFDSLMALPTNVNHAIKNVESFQCYPNPFGESVTFSFNSSEPGRISLSIFDISGRTITILTNEITSAGEQNIQWNGRDNIGKKVATGMYFYKLEMPSNIYKTGKIVKTN
jgi:hypothetical protein